MERQSDEWYTDSRRSTDATIYARRGNQWIGQVHARYADQIVTEHNEHAALRAQRDRLAAVLRQTLNAIEVVDFSVYPENAYDTIPWQEIDAALASVEQGEGEGET